MNEVNGVKVPVGRAEVNAYYGNPSLNGKLSSSWASENLIAVKPIYPVVYVEQDDDAPGGIKKIPLQTLRLHRKVEEPFLAAMEDVWNHVRVQVKREVGFDKTSAEYDALTLKKIQSLRLDQTGGAFNFRKIRGSATTLSTHSYGIAVDWDPIHNGLGVAPVIPKWFVTIWENHGWYWGGHFKRKDGMHFQLARGV